MNAIDFAHADAERNRDQRFLQARLQLVVDSLTATLYFNPAGGVLIATAFALGYEAFGRVSTANLAAVIAGQCLAGAAAWLTQRRTAHLARRDLRWAEWELTAAQGLIGLCWGSAAWLLWRSGNPANNVFIGMLMLCVTWMGAFARIASRRVFAAGITAITVLSAARYATASGVAAHVLLGLLPFWIGYILLMGIAARRRVDEALEVRFTNDDLGAALREAHDDALRKRYEAEAANASKTAFLANMSHELRTPLNAILGFSDIIAEQTFGANHPCYREYARDIHASGTHLLNLINDILDVAKIEAGKMEIDPKPLDVPQALAGVERLVALRASEKRQVLTFAADADMPMPMADERAFKQVVLNLVSNALKFTPEGGRVAVRARRAEDGGVVVTVEDNGPGIAREKLGKVFQAFSQVDNRYDRNAGGTGLGLALVQGLMRLHGGRAWIESEAGRGTKAFVYFPLGLTSARRDLSEAC